MSSRKDRLRAVVLIVAIFMGTSPAVARDRARDLGVPFEGVPGLCNAITDVPGIEVGQTTLIRGDGKLQTGRGPVRTGVTIIHPLGKSGLDAVAAGFSVINGTGEFTGTRMIEETGLLIGPIALTGTGNIPVVSQTMIDWATRPGYLPPDQVYWHLLPVVGETLDIPLNDVFGHVMTPADVIAALDSAKGGAVREGNVGGGTGMIAYGFKGGIGSASRVVRIGGKSFTVGVILQANNGRRSDLRIAGVPVGENIADLAPETKVTPAATSERPAKNSLLIVIATDAPLQPHQLDRLARRAALGVGRNGGTAGDISGEFALAFSTTNTSPLSGVSQSKAQINDLDSDTMSGLFSAAVQAVEEAIINQLVASETMQGADDVIVHGLPHDRLERLMKRYGRYTKSQPWHRGSCE